MAKIAIYTDDQLKDELAAILGAAFTRQEQMLMELATTTQAGFAQLNAAQYAVNAGLKVLTDLVLAKPAVLLTDDGKAQIAALQAQLIETEVNLASVTEQFHLVDKALADANQREAQVAQAISSAAQGFGQSMTDALALVTPAPQAPAETTTAPAAQDTLAGGEGNDVLVADPVADPVVEQPVEAPVETPVEPAVVADPGAAPVNLDSGTIEIPATPAEQVAESPSAALADQPAEPVGQGADVVTDNAFMAQPAGNQPVGPDQPFG